MTGNNRTPCCANNMPVRYVCGRDHSYDDENIIISESRPHGPTIHPQQQQSGTCYPTHLQNRVITRRHAEQSTLIRDSIVVGHNSMSAPVLPPTSQPFRESRSQVRFYNSATRTISNTRAQGVSCSPEATDIGGRFDMPLAGDSSAHRSHQWRPAPTSTLASASASASTRTVSSAMATSTVAVTAPQPLLYPNVASRFACSRPQPRAPVRAYVGARALCSCLRACSRGCRCTCHAVAISNCMRRGPTSSTVVKSHTDHHRETYEECFGREGNNNYGGEGNNGNADDPTSDVFVVNRTQFPGLFTPRPARVPERRRISTVANATATASLT